MKHRFEKAIIPHDSKYAEETCECGAVSRRYEKGYRLFPDENGKWSLKATPCNRSVKAVTRAEKATDYAEKLKRNNATPESLAIRRAELLSRGGPFTDSEKMVLSTNPSILSETPPLPGRVATSIGGIRLTDVEAKLKDAYVVINLLYKDLVAAGIWSPGRQIAGRLLYSAGYEESLKKLNA